MSGRALISLVDSMFGWKSRFSSAVKIGHGSSIAWRRIKNVKGNSLVVGENSMVHAGMSFEDAGGEIRSETVHTSAEAISFAIEASRLATMSSCPGALPSWITIPTV